MVCIRRATPADLPGMETCSWICQGEIYNRTLYAQYLLAWPQLAYVAEDRSNKIVGYLLGMIMDPLTKKKQNIEWTIPHDIFGRIISLAVMRPYRKMGIATKLLNLAHNDMNYVFGVEYAALRVNSINRVALILFQKMDYEFYVKVPHLFVNDEDAYVLLKQL